MARHVYDNPGPYYVSRDRVTFDSGRTYRLHGGTVEEAAHYLSHVVKPARHRGRHVPSGPHGMTPGEASVVLHFGLKMKKKRRRTTRAACAPCPPCRPRRRAAAKPRRRAVAATRRAPAAPPPPEPQSPDFWDQITQVYGGL